MSISTKLLVSFAATVVASEESVQEWVKAKVAAKAMTDEQRAEAREKAIGNKALPMFDLLFGDTDAREDVPKVIRFYIGDFLKGEMVQELTTSSQTIKVGDVSVKIRPDSKKVRKAKEAATVCCDSPHNCCTHCSGKFAL